ncbi:MAG: hypothetical protein GY950_19675 [bacterium]|nr:hypothetical protein [bacterium]
MSINIRMISASGNMSGKAFFFILPVCPLIGSRLLALDTINKNSVRGIVTK